jgi:predicted CoA-binding protein
MKVKNVSKFPDYDASNEEITEILTTTKTIAIVGLSPKGDRESNKVARYLWKEGYRIIPVNPKYKKIFGMKSYPDLAEIKEDVDVVEVFRKPSAMPKIAESAIKKGAKVVWMQEGIVNNEAASSAKKAGLKVVMDHCMMKEHLKLKRREANLALRKSALTIF